MAFIVIILLVLIFMLFIYAPSSKWKDENIGNDSDLTDEKIIDEILNARQISKVEIEQLPWKNRKYKNYSTQKQEEMHAKFMREAQAARLAGNESKAASIMEKVGELNAEYMINRQIKIHRESRKPININNPNDVSRLNYLLDEKLKSYEYKVLTDENQLNYKTVVSQRINDLEEKYKKLGLDEKNSNLRAKCELFSIKLVSE